MARTSSDASKGGQVSSDSLSLHLFIGTTLTPQNATWTKRDPGTLVSDSHSKRASDFTYIPLGWGGAEQGLWSSLTVGELRPRKKQLPKTEYVSASCLTPLCLQFAQHPTLGLSPTRTCGTLPHSLPIWSPGGSSETVVRRTKPGY